MIYSNLVAGKFLARPNRFIAHVELEGQPVVCHVKNTGRCRELLRPGATVYLQDFGPSPTGRKTRYDLIAVEKVRVDGSKLLINMDAQAPNQVFAEWARSGRFLPNLTLLRPETKWGSSRFDFYYETTQGQCGFVEVKGVTLEEDGIAAFPDAPTERGIKHLHELAHAAQAGYTAHICFIIQMSGMRQFCPNERTHPAFGAALRQAVQSGVQAFALECAVTSETLSALHSIPCSLYALDSFLPNSG